MSHNLKFVMNQTSASCEHSWKQEKSISNMSTKFIVNFSPDIFQLNWKITMKNWIGDGNGNWSNIEAHIDKRSSIFMSYLSVKIRIYFHRKLSQHFSGGQVHF